MYSPHNKGFTKLWHSPRTFSCVQLYTIMALTNIYGMYRYDTHKHMQLDIIMAPYNMCNHTLLWPLSIGASVHHYATHLYVQLCAAAERSGVYDPLPCSRAARMHENDRQVDQSSTNPGGGDGMLP